MARLIFWLSAMACSVYIVVFAAQSIIRTDQHLHAAALISQEIGLMSQQLAVGLERLRSARTKKEYRKHLKMMHDMMYVVELRHRSLTAGNPGFNADADMQTIIQAIYKDPQTGTNEIVAELITALNGAMVPTLREFRRTFKNASQLSELNWNELVNAVAANIHHYNTVREQRIISEVGMMTMSLLVLLVLVLGIYLVFLSKPVQAAVNKTAVLEQSVSTVLGPVADEVSISAAGESRRSPVFQVEP